MSEEGLIELHCDCDEHDPQDTEAPQRRPHPAQFSYTERWGSGNPAQGQLLQGLDQPGYSLRQHDTLLSPLPHPL